MKEKQKYCDISKHKNIDFACIKQWVPSKVIAFKVYANETSTIKTEKLLYHRENKDLQSCKLLLRKALQKNISSSMITRKSSMRTTQTLVCSILSRGLIYAASWLAMKMSLFLSFKRSMSMLRNMLRQNMQIFQIWSKHIEH